MNPIIEADITQKTQYELLLERDIELSKRINEYEFIHVMNNDKFTAPMIDFFIRNFPVDKHCFVFNKGIFEQAFPIPQYESVFALFDIKNIVFQDGIKKIFFNGLYDPAVIEFLYINRHLLKKSYWIIWGGDLYDQRSGIYDYVRRNFAGCACGIIDVEAYRRILGKDNTFYPIMIISPISLEQIKSAENKQKDYTQIQVNHSAHYSSIEILHNLEVFRDNKIKVVTNVSYLMTQYGNVITELGNIIFGDRFHAVKDYLPPSEHVHNLAANDVLILNHPRPAGMTTVFTSLVMGKKLFVRSNIQKELEKEGLKLEATEYLRSLTFEQLLDNPYQEQNRQAALLRFDEEHIKNLWGNLFDA